MNPRSWVIHEEYLPLVGSNSVTFLGRTIALRYDLVIDCLIKWVQLAPACDHSPSPEPPLSPCLDTADLLSLFFYQFNLPSSLCFEQNFYFAQCPKRQEDVNNFRVTLVELLLSSDYSVDLL